MIDQDRITAAIMSTGRSPLALETGSILLMYGRLSLCLSASNAVYQKQVKLFRGLLGKAKNYIAAGNAKSAGRRKIMMVVLRHAHKGFAAAAIREKRELLTLCVRHVGHMLVINIVNSVHKFSLIWQNLEENFAVVGAKKLLLPTAINASAAVQLIGNFSRSITKEVAEIAIGKRLALLEFASFAG